MSDLQPVLIVSDLSVEYRVSAQRNSENRRQKLLAMVMGKTETIQALKNISLVVNHGETIGVIGRSGSGKSTLVRVLAGLEKPTSGAVWAKSLPTTLSVSGTLLKGLSGSRNIRLSLFALGMNRNQVEERYREILKSLNFKEAIHRPLNSYSSGMLMKLKIAIAMSRTPEILLIDQKLQGGNEDSVDGDASVDNLNNLREKAGVVILVHKNPKVIAANCSRAIWLDKGEIKADGPAAEVIAKFEATNKKRKPEVE